LFPAQADVIGIGIPDGMVFAGLRNEIAFYIFCGLAGNGYFLNGCLRN
jgi:hypothetical protein